MKVRVSFLVCIAVLVVGTNCRNHEKTDVPRAAVMKEVSELEATWERLETKIRDNPGLWEDVDRMFGGTAKVEGLHVKRERLEQLYGLLTDPNSNPASAHRALEAFVKLGASEVVRESLLNPRKDVPGWDLVITAGEAVTHTKDEKAVPHLICVLERNNYPQEGSEEATIHIIMKRNLLEAIGTVTGLDTRVSDVDNIEEVDRVLSEARAWAKREGLTLFEE
ncbi:MAG: hypothetical protein ACYTBJ_24890 [Planctomycetota bacterium]